LLFLLLPLRLAFSHIAPPTQFLFPISHGPEYFSLPKRETEACLKREPTTKINKPHVQGSASNNINANTLFLKIELLVIKMPNKKSFCCKSLSKIFFCYFYCCH
jgi:hypothetical protein